MCMARTCFVVMRFTNADHFAIIVSHDMHAGFSCIGFYEMCICEMYIEVFHQAIAKFRDQRDGHIHC
jgi:hypothetical protein